MSAKIRKRFRQEKKANLVQKKADDIIKDRYGLPESLKLVADDPSMTQDAKSQWEKGRQELRLQAPAKRRKFDTGIVPMRTAQNLSSASASSTASQSKSLETLRTRILENTARQSSAFGSTRKKPPNVGDRF